LIFFDRGSLLLDFCICGTRMVTSCIQIEGDMGMIPTQVEDEENDNHGKGIDKAEGKGRQTPE